MKKLEFEKEVSLKPLNENLYNEFSLEKLEERLETDPIFVMNFLGAPGDYSSHSCADNTSCYSLYSCGENDSCSSNEICDYNGACAGNQKCGSRG